MEKATQNIDALVSRMPEGYEQACYEKKAIIRKREIKNPVDLLKLAMMYLVGGYTLLEMCVIAKQLGIANLSDTAFMNRFAQCKDWFAWIISQIIPKPIIEYEKPKNLQDYTIAAVDASDVREKGRAGQLFRLHYIIDIFSMCAITFKLTDRKTGESLVNFDIDGIGKKLLIVADRAYGTIKSIGHCIENGASFVFRLKYKAFELYDSDGNKLNILDLISEATSEVSINKEVYVKVFNSELIKLRLCARKIPDEKLEQTKTKGYRKGKGYKKREKTSDEATIMRNFVVVITNLPALVTADEIMNLYQLRWQIELYFKRLKSIMDFGNVPLKREDSIMCWLCGKMIVALQVEQMLSEVSFSP